MRGANGSDIESLAGLFHPHAIEVQDFSHYARIVDLRSQAEYENDHIPGASRVQAPEGVDSTMRGDWSREFGSAFDAVVPVSRSRRPVLLYCGDAGQVSGRAAGVLRGRGMNVDVLPGGWINYRRWVEAGLELLPRYLTFAVIVSPDVGEASRVLRALKGAGRQVLDVVEIGSTTQQPQQAAFESRLLQDLRGFDPRLPVWAGDFEGLGGGLSMPGALSDSLAMAPTAELQIDARAVPLPGERPALERRENSGTTDRVAGRTRLPPLRVDSAEPRHSSRR